MSAIADNDARDSRFARLVANIRERWWAVVFTMIVVGGLVFGVSLLLDPQYKTTTQLRYEARNADMASQALISAGTAELDHNISNDALALQTSDFAARVSQAMGGALDSADLRSSIRVAADSVAQVIRVTAVSADPGRAAEIADAFAAQFVVERKGTIEEALTEAQDLLEARIAALTAQEAESDRALALQQQSTDLGVFLSRQISDYEVIQKALVPTSAYSPRPIRNLLLGLAGGLILGLILALLLGYFDRRIKDRATLERVVGLPVLGTMPAYPRSRGIASGQAQPTVGFPEGDEALLEAMRMLRSNLKVLGFGETKRSILVTSAAPGEGKSTLAVNLALTMALSGDRVILVDGDLRNPSIDRYLGIPNNEGLGDILMEHVVSWSTKIQAVDLAPFVSPRLSLARKSNDRETPISKFLCLTSGTLPGSPTEILESSAMGDLLADLQGISDYVIVDGPPMLVASDSLILAQSVDAVVLASTLGRETAAEAVQVRQLLARAEIAALGIVICGDKVSAREGYKRRPDREGRPAARAKN
jgi:capsular exopolysaccharide synthesis family protein